MKKNENIKKDGLSSSSVEETYVIPYEAACSPEFSEGCIIMEDEADKVSEEK